MAYDKIVVPADGQAIAVNPDNSLNVPDNPIIPYIEGDGIGVDITPVMQKVINAAVEKAYGCLLYTSPSPRDRTRSRMPSSA